MISTPNSRIAQILEELEKTKKKFKNISRETGELFYAILKSMKAENAIEIGTSTGYSAIWLSMAAKKVITMEVDPERVVIARENFRKAGITNIEVIEGKALDNIKNLKLKFDFAFIDAAKLEYTDFFKALLPKMNHNSIVVAHNVISHKNLVKGLFTLLDEKGIDYTVLDVDTGMCFCVI